MSGYSFNRQIIDYCLFPRFGEPRLPTAPRVVDRIIIPPPQRRVTIDQIQRAAAEHFGIPLREMTSQRRSVEVARPRQVAMYLCKQRTPKSLPEIGRRFGNRDHTTVIHAIRRVAVLRATDLEFDQQVTALEAML
jgi:chromosomal replication initiator protein